MSDVREHVRREALALFLQHGYEGASLRDIAGRVGVTPAALYYHYRTKDALLDDLLGPLLSRIEDLATQLERQQARGHADARIVLHRLLDEVLTDSDTFRVVITDIAVRNHPVIGPRIAAADERLRMLLGSREHPLDRVMTSAALGVLFRPIAMQPDGPIEDLRDPLVEGALGVLSRAPEPTVPDTAS